MNTPMQMRKHLTPAADVVPYPRPDAGGLQEFDALISEVL